MQLRRVQARADQNAGGTHARQLAQKRPGARVGGLAQPVLAGEGLRRAHRQANCPGDIVGGLFVEIVVRQPGGIHARVGDQNSLQAIQHEQEWLGVEKLQQLCLALGGRHFLHFCAGAPAHVGQRAGDEVLEGYD